MSDLDDKLNEIQARAEKAAGARSDDFGHSVSACMEWQVSQLEGPIERDVHALIAMLRRAIEQRDKLVSSLAVEQNLDGSGDSIVERHVIQKEIAEEISEANAELLALDATASSDAKRPLAQGDGK